MQLLSGMWLAVGVRRPGPLLFAGDERDGQRRRAMKQGLWLTALPVLVLLFSVGDAAADGCKAKFVVVKFIGPSNNDVKPNVLSNNQIKWWLKESQKKYKKICLVENPKLADYAVMWWENVSDRQVVVNRAVTSTTQENGRAQGTATGSSTATAHDNYGNSAHEYGSSSTSGSASYNRASTTTTQVPVEQTVTSWTTGIRVWRLQRDERGNVVGGLTIPVFVTDDAFNAFDTDPDKDVFARAIEFIAKQ
jgi:hypothetical protein